MPVNHAEFTRLSWKDNAWQDAAPGSRMLSVVHGNSNAAWLTLGCWDGISWSMLTVKSRSSNCLWILWGSAHASLSLRFRETRLTHFSVSYCCRLGPRLKANRRHYLICPAPFASTHFMLLPPSLDLAWHKWFIWCCPSFHSSLIRAKDGPRAGASNPACTHVSPHLTAGQCDLSICLALGLSEGAQG